MDYLNDLIRISDFETCKIDDLLPANTTMNSLIQTESQRLIELSCLRFAVSSKYLFRSFHIIPLCYITCICKTAYRICKFSLVSYGQGTKLQMKAARTPRSASWKRCRCRRAREVSWSWAQAADLEALIPPVQAESLGAAVSLA